MVKICTIMIAVLLSLLAAHALFVLAAPATMLEGDFQAMAGKSYRGVLEPDAVRVAIVHIRHMEVNGITAAIAGFSFYSLAFARKESGHGGRC